MSHFFIALLGISQVFARAGGGGSHSGGSHSSGFSSYGGSSNGLQSSSTSVLGFIFPIIVLAVVCLVLYAMLYLFFRFRSPKSLSSQITTQDFGADPLTARAAEVFTIFQTSWSNFQVEGLTSYLTENYYKRIVLELNVLQAMGRQNLVQDSTISSMNIIEQTTDSTFTVQIKAQATDSLVNTISNNVLYTDNEPFIEYWKFVMVEGIWKLDLISQATEAASLQSAGIIQFADRNGFFYDPDFGSLMLPDKGAIFNAATFGSADINNHVIGFYKEKIVEFYTYQPQASDSFTTPSYCIAQAVLPSNYRDILVTQRGIWNIAPHGMVNRTLESPDFNKKFALYADPLDQYSSWVLLAPDFMERMTNLNFDINIEVVGNFLYFYTKDTAVKYDQLLEILNAAFSEMK